MRKSWQNALSAISLSILTKPGDTPDIDNATPYSFLIYNMQFVKKSRKLVT